MSDDKRNHNDKFTPDKVTDRNDERVYSGDQGHPKYRNVGPYTYRVSNCLVDNRWHAYPLKCLLHLIRYQAAKTKDQELVNDRFEKSRDALAKLLAPDRLWKLRTIGEGAVAELRIVALGGYAAFQRDAFGKGASNR